jgi:hypothetical protein
LKLAQSQGTTCSCAVNGNDFREQHLDRLGGVDPNLFISQLPSGSCEIDNDQTTTTSSCVTIPQQPYYSNESPIEWSGIWQLEGGKTYEWTFHAYSTGINGTFGYPDPGMFVYAVPSTDIASVIGEADDALIGAIEDGQIEIQQERSVSEGQTVLFDEAYFISFTDPDTSPTTTVLFQPSESISLAVFTQHVPSEFMAHVLREQDSGEYIHPTSMILYVHNSAGNDEDIPLDDSSSSFQTLTYPIVTIGTAVVIVGLSFI